MNKEQSSVTFKTTFIYGVIDSVFSQIFVGIMPCMLRMSHSPNMVSFFTNFISFGILSLPEILFCFDEGIMAVT